MSPDSSLLQSALDQIVADIEEALQSGDETKCQFWLRTQPRLVAKILAERPVN